MDKPVCILGCGPAGLFAAHAIACQGAPFVIFSIKQKSEIYGAQYLQAPIPGIADVFAPHGMIKTILMGNKENYARRVYGDPNEATSWPQFPREAEPAWDLRMAYDALWESYKDLIIDQVVTPEDVVDMTARFPVVISTVPAWRLCLRPSEHKFHSMNILHSEKMEYTGLSEVFMPDHNVVVYNGTEYNSWYRTAHIFGHESTERVIVQNGLESLSTDVWSPGYKVLGNDCDCHPNLVRTGRLGTWKRGVLTHMAFEHATAAYMEALAV